MTLRSVLVVSLRSFSVESGDRNSTSPDEVDWAMTSLIDEVVSRPLWSLAPMAFSAREDIVLLKQEDEVGISRPQREWGKSLTRDSGRRLRHNPRSSTYPPKVQPRLIGLNHDARDEA